MAAISVTINLTEVLSSVDSIFDKLKDKEYLLRPLAIETIPNMKERIHKDGLASDGAQIGTYSNGYMRTREKIRGNDGTGKMVIVSLTSKLEQDWQAIKTDNGWAIGFNNPLNRDKARWVEETYKKIIFNLSAAEQDYITERLNELIDGAINS